MAKKKPVSSEFSAVDKGAEELENMSESDRLQAKAGSVELGISEEIKQKLDAFDKLADENAKYAKQVSQLQDHIAEYIKEINGLKQQLASHAIMASPEAREDKLRIEELETENSRLNAELNALKQRLEQRVEQQFKQMPSPMPKIHMTRNIYRRQIDGYSSWN